MSYQIANNSQTKITAQAAVDLTASQYLFVKQVGVNGQGLPTVGPITAITDIPLGILANNPKATEEAEVVVAGGSKCIASGALVSGLPMGTDATGKVRTLVPGTDLTAYLVGRTVEPAAAVNQVVFILLDCSAPGRAS